MQESELHPHLQGVVGIVGRWRREMGARLSAGPSTARRRNLDSCMATLMERALVKTAHAKLFSCELEPFPQLAALCE